MPKTIKKDILHFTIDGKWFTWLLRHLWVEGSYQKAWNIWADSFPQYSDVRGAKKFFIPLVAGKRKFIGNSNGEGLQYDIDNKKCWDPNQDGKEEKQFPLLDSWEDVIRLEKIRLFFKELELILFRLNRGKPNTYEENKYNALNWIEASKENRIENRMREKINLIYNCIINMGKLLEMDVYSFQSLPDIPGLWEEKNFRNYTDLSKEKWNRETKELNYKLYCELREIRDKEQKYFKGKYKVNLLYISDETISCITNFYPKITDKIDKELKDKKEEFLNNNAEVFTSSSQSLDSFITETVEFDKLTKNGYNPDDPMKTKFSSGYIDKEGKWYPVPKIQHNYYSKLLVEEYEYIMSKDEKKQEDTMRTLERLGWVKVSVRRIFFNEHARMTPNKRQINTIYKLVVENWGMSTVAINFKTIKINELYDNLEGKL